MGRGILAVALSLAFAGCATIMEGTSQTLIVDVVPAHGRCEVLRDGVVLGQSSPGSRAVSVSKSKSDLLFNCSAEGYPSKSQTLSSALAAATVASFFLLDFGLVDAATGAWMKYPERVTIVMDKAGT